MWYSSPVSFEDALKYTDLSDLNKLILTRRFLNVLADYKRRCSLLSFYFHAGRFIVTVGSLIVPGLLSIQYMDMTSGREDLSNISGFSHRVYWATWVISLLVTTCNGILSLFKVEKKYYFLHTTFEHLKSEGWQYLELSGRYSGFHTPGQIASHENQFVYFVHMVEKLKMKQVEEEYYKVAEAKETAKVLPLQDEKQKGSLIPPSPLKNIIEQGKILPKELLVQLQSIQEDSDGKVKADELIESLGDVGYVGDDGYGKRKSSYQLARESKAPVPMSPRMQESDETRIDILRKA